MAGLEGDRDDTQNGEDPPNINAILRDDDLHAVLSKLTLSSDRDACALVCRRWKAVQDGTRRSMRLRAGRVMLERVAARFSGLTDLDLSESTGRSFYLGWQDDDLALVARSFGHLERLNLHNCRGITDKALAVAGQSLPKLQWLNLSDCKQITDTGVERVASGCPNLRSLDLSRCKLITNNSLAALSQCRHLDTLLLRGCTKVGDDGLIKLSEGCSNFQLLDFTECAQVGDVGLTFLIRSNPSLHTLVLEDCPQVGDATLTTTGECCPALHTLLLGGCRLLGDHAMNAYFRKHTHLSILRVEHCLKLTDHGISSIFLNCLSLEVLDVRCCSRLTDGAFETLRPGSGLRELKVSGCNGVSSVSMARVAAACPSLRLVEAKYCEFVGMEGVIRAGFPEGCKVVLFSETLVF